MNGNKKEKEKVEMNGKMRPLIRSRGRALIQDFAPIWFTWCMNTGILSILLHQHPYQFHGIHTLSTIGFVLNLVLFIFFSIVYILRFVVFGYEAYREVTGDIAQLTTSACWVIGYLTIPGCVSLIVSQAYWGGYWAALLAYVLWWIGAAWMLLTLSWAFIVLTRRHMAGGGGKHVESEEGNNDTSKNNTTNQPVPTLIVIPAVGVVTAALIGAEIVSYSNHMNSRLAVPVIIAAIPLCGLGMILAVLLYSILFRELLEGGFPPPMEVTSMFVYIGPFGQSAAALQAFGEAAVAWFRTYRPEGAPPAGTFITLQAAESLSAACTIGALLLLGPAVWFIIFSIWAVIDQAVTTRSVKWSPSWNAVIFPTATVTTATTYFSVQMDSPTFRVLTSIQLIALFIVYFINVGYTLMGIFNGELLIVREDPRVKAEMEKEEKGK